MVRCNNCGAEVENSTFCFNCGEKLDLSSGNGTSNTCPKCGVVNNEDTNFCVGCGYKLKSGPSYSYKEKEWEARRDEILKRYDQLAVEFGIKDEDYFLTSVRRFNFLETGTTKHKKINALLV